jgi:hypothetical protein
LQGKKKRKRSFSQALVLVVVPGPPAVCAIGGKEMHTEGEKQAMQGFEGSSQRRVQQNWPCRRDDGPQCPVEEKFGACIGCLGMDQTTLIWLETAHASPHSFIIGGNLLGRPSHGVV